jgi:undecaprenyl pyrophosphate synthase
MNRQEIYDAIQKVIKECTNLDGHIRADNFRKELLIEVFPEIDDTEGLLTSHNKS